MKKEIISALLAAVLCGTMLAGCEEETSARQAAQSAGSASVSSSVVEAVVEESVTKQSEAEPVLEAEAVISGEEAVSVLEESEVSDTSAVSVSSSSVEMAAEDADLITIGGKDTGFSVKVNESILAGGYDTYGEGEYAAILYLYPTEDQMSSIACQRFDTQTKTVKEFVESMVSGYGAEYAKQAEVTSVTMGGHIWWTETMEMKIGDQKDIISFFASDIDGVRMVLTAKERVEDKEQTEISATVQLLMDQCMDTVTIVE